MPSVALASYLIIDDSPTIRLTIDRILRTIDADNPEIQHAASAKQAVQLFDEKSFDLIFLDIQLGDATGNVLLRDILRREPAAKVIVVSTFSRRDPRVEDAMGQGALAYIEKPLRREQFATVMQDVEREFRPTRRIR